jgi:acyl carrier protein
MSLQNQVVEILVQVLQLPPKTVSQVSADTQLLGTIPEFDSMAVVTIITALEDRFGFTIDDDEIDASIFETVGSLVAFVEAKF